MIQAVIFDMDGVLIDSEPLWAEAEIEAFGAVGIELDHEACKETVGIGIGQVVGLRYGQQPWVGKSQGQVVEEIENRVIELVTDRGQAMEGVAHAIALVRSKGVKLGLATSSHPGLVEATVTALGLTDAFDHVQSASSLDHGKPHPAVYLETASRMGVAPIRCVAIEDSFSGLVAAKAARMTAVAVPEPSQRKDPRLAIADLMLSSLADLDEACWKQLEAGIP